MEDHRIRPVLSLTLTLAATYRAVNKRYSEKKRIDQQGGSGGASDARGNYIVQPGEELASRYIVKEIIGRGSFGVVVKAFDFVREERRSEDCSVQTAVCDSGKK